MRWLLALVFVAASGAATWTGTREDSGLTLRIGPSIPLPESADVANALGRRSWFLGPRITVRSNRACGELSLVTSAHALFDGHRYARGAVAGGGSALMRGTNTPAGFRGGAWDEAWGDAGDTVVLSATARCTSAARIDSVTRTVRFAIPAASCDRGPLRVFELDGTATRRDDNYEERFEPLRAGDLVGESAELRVGAGSRVVVGAPECNGFRMVLFPGSYEAGSYSRYGRGYDFVGDRVLGRGDGRAGGLAVPGRANVQPLGETCRDCAAPPIASYAVRTTRGPGGSTIVRVYRGAVRVRGTNRRVRVRWGYQVTVRCAGAGRCEPGKPRIFQPHEPWESPPRAPLGAFVRSTGAQPPVRRLAPRLASRSLRLLPAAGKVPDQAIVVWSRALRGSSGGLTEEQGAILWQRASGGWRRVYSIRIPYGPTVTAQVGDVTGDGHLDVLLSESQGSGGCGVRRVVATVDGRTRELFRTAEVCDTVFVTKGGSLQIDEPVGPCPYDQAGAHCAGGVRHVRMRWNGARLVESSRRVECALPRLDPARGCLPRR